MPGEGRSFRWDNISIITSGPRKHAVIKGVCPDSLAAFGLAPASSRSFAISGRPARTALGSATEALALSFSEGSRNNRAKISRCPCAAAAQIASPSVGKKGSAPASSNAEAISSLRDISALTSSDLPKRSLAFGDAPFLEAPARRRDRPAARHPSTRHRLASVRVHGQPESCGLILERI